MAAQDLCTLSDVRASLELPAADTSRDALISALITQASDAIMNEVSREFAPATASATRRFELRTLNVNLEPYDLRSTTAVSLHPETSSPIALTVTTDYQLKPTGAPSGTYTSIQFSALLSSYVGGSAFGFGYALVDVSGAWGFASIPTDVVRACVLTVSSWLRRDITAIALASEQFLDARGLAPSLPSSFSIPGDAKRLLSSYYRLTNFVAV